MSVMRVKCSCGAELELRAWLVREFDVGWWVQLHAACSAAGKEGKS